MSNPALSIISLSGRLDAASRALNRFPSRHANTSGFWAKLTAATSVDANRWKYAWTEVVWGMSGGILTYSVPADARVGSASISGIGTTGYAWNSLEMDNTAADVGSGWSDDTLSKAGGTLVIEAVNPIGTTQKGSSKLPIVWMRPVGLSTSNHLVYLFSGWNTPTITGTGVTCGDAQDGTGSVIATTDGGMTHGGVDTSFGGSAAGSLSFPADLANTTTDSGCRYSVHIIYSLTITIGTYTPSFFDSPRHFYPTVQLGGVLKFGSSPVVISESFDAGNTTVRYDNTSLGSLNKTLELVESTTTTVVYEAVIEIGSNARTSATFSIGANSDLHWSTSNAGGAGGDFYSARPTVSGTVTFTSTEL